ncbi:hypothetical protein Vadar_010043 [Vaccinium darrowii]|uniref:Uncharacterized protein n=1 Tax=Vaccinium darrowii TaxID=229202 RepID=A0ACB7YU97_9ERIC|nr:hypothetical protein Vadar_010043 [Vaccinium darrowii]
MLRGLMLERSHTKEAMGFSLDNADAIVEVLTEFLMLKETPIPAKVARLLLVSGILHNSSVPEESLSRPLRTSYGSSLEIEKKASSQNVGGAGVNQDAA